MNMQEPSKENNLIRHDPAFKNLFMDFPEDTLRWLLPKALEEFGPVRKVEALRQETRKRWLTDAGRELDLPLQFTFENGKLIITLIEHQHSKAAFSIYKLGHYTLDLMEAHPSIGVVPMVVFADDRQWRKDVIRELDNTVLGRTWFRFEYVRMKLKEHPAREMLKQENPLFPILVANFWFNEAEKVSLLRAALIKMRQVLDDQRFLKYLDFPERYGKLTGAEQESLISELEKDGTGMTIREIFTERGRKEGLKEGWQEGRQEGLEEGLQGGHLQGKRGAIKMALETRFGRLDAKCSAKIDAIESIEELDKLLRQALVAAKFTDVEI